jgi:fibro-slime domain-containing protein
VINQPGEQCDDGNTTGGDGCSETCKLEANYRCPTQGQPCVSTVVCGDGIVNGNEQCDNGNTAANDGCSDTCQVEMGWACPDPGRPCVAAQCGDGIVGFKCDVPGMPCSPTTCGDGVAEGTEQCDDGNTDLGDGCNPFCQREPDCSQGACRSSCGDGILLGDEECDDGNNRDGDGCSHDCKKEVGFYCTQPPLADQLVIPLVIRDFFGLDPNPSVNAGPPPDYSQPNHVDFELVSGEPGGTEDGTGTNKRIVRANSGSAATGRGLDLGRPGETWDIQHLDGSVIATVPLTGKPVFAQDRATCDKTALPSAANSFAKCTVTVMDADSFHSWYVDHDTTNQIISWPNGHLALDIGGIHGRQAKSFVIDTANATAWGLQGGQVYEIAVFQAERNVVASNYLLTLRGFNTQKSQCQSMCGDGILASDELCDDGANISAYDFDGHGCAPGCKKPPYCGDGKIQAPFESCDDGVNDGSYGGCTTDCQLGPRCGDRQVQMDQGEQCDDGPGGSATCTPSCHFRRPQG